MSSSLRFAVCGILNKDDIDFIMSVQHQVQAFEEKNEANAEVSRWSSAPKSRTPGRWLSDSLLSSDDKSNIQPPRQPRKHRRAPGQWMSDSRISLNDKSEFDFDCRPHEDFRWKDNNMREEPSGLIPIQPMRRSSIECVVNDIQEVMLSLNHCQLSAGSNHSQDLCR